MLLTSAQVSVAISSIIVFFFTTTLFLSGYVLQQQTVKSLREAIKPRPRPTHTSFYLPPQFQPTSTPGPGDKDAGQTIEITIDSQGTNDGDGHTINKDIIVEQATEGQQFLQSASRLTDPVEDNAIEPPGIGNKEYRKTSGGEGSGQHSEPSKERPTGGDSDPGRSAEGDNVLAPVKRLSMAARRRAIKEEIQRLSGQDLLDNPRVYRRRLW